MNYYAGLDVSLEETAICVVDADGAIVKEVRAESAPDALDDALKRLDLPLERVGMEACSLTAWLHDGLTEAGWPAICIETRQANAAMKTMPNKTDRNDARARPWGCGDPTAPQGGADHAHRLVPPGARQEPPIAPLALALGGPAHRVEPHAQHRECHPGHHPRGRDQAGHAEPQGFCPARARDGRQRARADGDPGAALGRAGLDDRGARPADQAGARHRQERGELQEADDRPPPRPAGRVPFRDRIEGLLAFDGIGPINALTYRATIDRPERFAKSRNVGAHLGLTPSRYQSGETDIVGKISRCGDELARTGLVEAAHTLLARGSKWSALRVWGLAVAKRRGMAKAKIAVARKLAVILHRMWIDDADFSFAKET